MDKHLGFQDHVQTRLVHKTEVRHIGILIYKTMEKKKSIISKIKANERKIHI